MKINSFLGIHNTLTGRHADGLGDAVDVDLTDSGAILARRGTDLVKSLPISTAFKTQALKSYVVSDGELSEVLEDLSLVSLALSTATEFSEFGNVVFTNDGFKIDGRSVVNLKLDTPETPLIMQTTPGILPAGTYSATYTYRSATLESGSAPIVAITLAEEGGIYIEPPTAPTGYAAIVYVTDGNGTVYYNQMGVPLPTVNILADPFPVAEKIAYHASRLYCAEYLSGGQTVVRFSQAFHYHLFDYLKDLFIVPGFITGMMSAGNDLIITTGHEIYAYTADKKLQVLANYGTPQGRPMAKHENGQVYIHTKRGECRALPFENLTEDKASLQPGLTCSTFISNHDGIGQFVVLIDGESQAFNPFN